MTLMTTSSELTGQVFGPMEAWYELRTFVLHKAYTRWAWPKEAWWISYARLWQANGEPGWPNLPRSHPSGLGRWLHNQRSAYTNGKLASDRAEALTSLPGFEWKPKLPPKARLNGHTTWRKRYQSLVGLAFTPGVNWPNIARTHESSLGMWLTRQRTAYRRDNLPYDKVKLLEALPGFDWKQTRGRECSRPSVQ